MTWQKLNRVILSKDPVCHFMHLSYDLGSLEESPFLYSACAAPSETEIVFCNAQPQDAQSLPWKHERTTSAGLQERGSRAALWMDHLLMAVMDRLVPPLTRLADFRDCSQHPVYQSFGRWEEGGKLIHTELPGEKMGEREEKPQNVKKYSIPIKVWNL